MSPQDHPSAGMRDERVPPGETVGSSLRAARFRLGQELSDVAAVLRIRAPYLQAIEEGQFQALPGVPYAIGFVRTYAEHLGLDGAEIVRRFKSEAAGLERKTNLSFPSPAPEGRVPGTAALLISLVAVTLVFGGWYLYLNGSVRPGARVSEVPERLAGPPPAAPGLNMGGLGDTPGDKPATGVAPAAGPVATPPAATAAAPAPAAAPPSQAGAAPSGPSAGLPAPPTPGTAPTRAAPVVADAALPPPPGDPTRRLPAPAAPAPAAAVPAAPAAGAPAEPEDSPPPDPTSLAAAPAPGGAIPPVPQVAAAPADGRVFGAQNADSRVVIKAHGESWVQIRDASNTPLLTRVLRPGDSYRVPNQGGLTMMTGNAGVLDVFVDGAAAPSLGAVGQVRRNIGLDADRLRAGAAGPQ
jgi:cytoskeletal protein RodZ